MDYTCPASHTPWLTSPPLVLILTAVPPLNLALVLSAWKALPTLPLLDSHSPGVAFPDHLFEGVVPPSLTPACFSHSYLPPLTIIYITGLTQVGL
jgi:hypothetical protein